jgi:hypothetical protein
MRIICMEPTRSSPCAILSPKRAAHLARYSRETPQAFQAGRLATWTKPLARRPMGARGIRSRIGAWSQEDAYIAAVTDEQQDLFANIYQEQPASPIVECWRYANRRSTDIRSWPGRLRERGLYTVLVLLVLWLASGSTKVWSSVPTLLAALVVSVVIAPAAQWVYHFVTAPYGLLKDESAATRQRLADSMALITDLTAKIEGATTAKRQAIGVAGSLVSFREEAVHKLLNRSVKTDVDLEQLKADITDWERRVIGYMEQNNIPLGRISTFRVLGAYVPSVRGGYNEEHRRELSMLWERMNRLLDLLNEVAK